MATSLHAELVALYVETPASIRMTAVARERLAENMRLVEALGGEPVTLRGEDAARETVRYARKRNVTKIVVGKPTHPRWRDIVKPPFLEDLVRQSREIDVYVISGLSGQGGDAPVYADENTAEPGGASGYAAGVAVVVASTLIAWFAFGRTQLTDVVMILLLGVVVVSMRFGYGPSLLAAVSSVLAFDFFFTPPFFSFAVSDLSHVVTFSVMFIVAFVISNLTKRIRQQADSARERERHTASLYAVSRELATAQSQVSLLAMATRHIREAFDAKVAVLLPGREGSLELALSDEGTLVAGDSDLGVADWVWQHQHPAGAGTDTLPSARALFYPLKGSRDRVGVLALFASAPRLRSADGRQLLDTIAGLTGSALERIQLAEQARLAALRIETEQLRNALLSSVSHDLRTPLAVVTGATSALLDEAAPLDEDTRRDLLRTAHQEALRLNRLVGNVLDMTRLEAGALKVHKDLQPVEEVIGSALNRLEDRLAGRLIETSIPADLPLVPLDSALIEQVLINLLENATKYTPQGTPLEVGACSRAGEVEIHVADRGPGVARADTERVFDKFYRAREREGGGVGLGLTICRGIVSAHGGRIWVDDRSGGGAVFRFTLPLGLAIAPPLEPELGERAPR